MNIDKEFCSLWRTELIWNFNFFGRIEFYFDYSFLDCQEFQIKDLFENAEYQYIVSNLILFTLAFCQLIIISRKIWFNLLTFLRMKNKYTREKDNEDESSAKENASENKNDISYDKSDRSSVSDNCSINNKYGNVENIVNYNESQFYEDISKL